MKKNIQETIQKIITSDPISKLVSKFWDGKGDGKEIFYEVEQARVEAAMDVILKAVSDLCKQASKKGFIVIFDTDPMLEEITMGLSKRTLNGKVTNVIKIPKTQIFCEFTIDSEEEKK